MLLEGYAELLPQAPSYDPLPLSDVNLKIIMIAIGALLNLSLGYGTLWVLSLALWSNSISRTDTKALD